MARESAGENIPVTRQRRSELAWTVMGVGVLGAVVAAGTVLAVAFGGDDPAWRRAVAFAVGISLVGSLGGWLVARWPTDNPAGGVARVLGAVVMRMFVPLTALAWLQSGGRELRDAAADTLLLIFYLALLATDIFLHIMGGRNPSGNGGENVAN